VTSLGARLWRQRLETMAGNEAEPDVTNEPGDATNPEAKEAAGEPAWTPAGIAGAIESLVMHAAHMMRRARWYGLLSESCLAWASNDNPKVLDNLVVVENGTIRRQDVTGAGQRVPDPAGFGRPWLVRRSNLDLAAYDRMRVVTTELRRLVREGRKIELRLGPNARLTRAELTRALKWV
jgi:DNA polymerase III subunit epsilon